MRDDLRPPPRRRSLGAHAAAWATVGAAALAASMQAAAAPAPQPLAFRVVADDVSAAGLVIAVARTLGANVLVVGDPLRRVTLDAGFASTEEFLRSHASSLALASFDHLNVQVLAPPGCTPAAVGSMPPVSREPVSIAITFVEPGTLMAMLADFSDIRLGPPAPPASPPGRAGPVPQLLSVHTTQLPASDTYALLSSLSGAGLQRQPDGRFALVEQSDPACTAMQPSARVVEAVVGRFARAGSSTCPRQERDRRQHRIASPRACDPLERFAADDLVLRGRIEREGGTAALIEGPDGLTYAAKAGDAIGHNDGRILRIDETGLTLQERAAPGRALKRVLVDYRNKRRVLD